MRKGNSFWLIMILVLVCGVMSTGFVFADSDDDPFAFRGGEALQALRKNDEKKQKIQGGVFRQDNSEERSEEGHIQIKSKS